METEHSSTSLTTRGMSKTLVVLLVILILLFLGGGAWYWYTQMRPTKTTTPTTTTPTTPTTTPTTTQPTTTTTDETADWKTYTNTKYGYSVKYSPTSTYKELSSTGTEGPDKGYIVDFSGVDGLTIRIEATKNFGAKTLKEIIDSSSLPLNVSDRKSYTEISVGNESVYKYINYLDATKKDKKIGSTVLLVKGDYYYQISTGNQYAPEFTKELENTFDKFVSTFQFTP